MNRPSFRHVSTGAALAFGLLSSGAASAQLTTGSFQGDAPTGASVVLRNPATNHTLATVVASNGRFHFRRTRRHDHANQCHPGGRIQSQR